ncbi:MAG: DUF6455 family protein [Marinibacterium sp.]
MQPRGPMMRHWQRVSRMARSTDTDIVRAFDEGRLSPDTWSTMVTACQGCTWAVACDGWLDAHESIDRPPHSCVNRARFAALRAAQDGENA